MRRLLPIAVCKPFRVESEQAGCLEVVLGAKRPAVADLGYSLVADAQGIRELLNPPILGRLVQALFDPSSLQPWL